MRSFLCIFFLCTLALGAQTVKRKYKLFSDTAFKAGDILLVPEVIYNISSCELFPQAKDSITLIAVFIKQHPAFKIEIGNHTDLPQRPSASLQLSQCRAQSVVDYLVKEFSLPPERLTAKGYNSTQPIVSNEEINRRRCCDCPSPRQKNRRTELKILSLN